MDTTSNLPPHAQAPTDEIDLRDLFRQLLRVLRKNYLLFAGLFLVGGLVGLAAFLLLPKVYKTQLIASSKSLAATDATELVNSWQKLIKEKETSVLAKKLGIDPEMLTELQKIEAEVIEPTNFNQDANSFIVRVSVYDTQVIDTLQQAFITYMQRRVAQNTRTERKNLVLLKKKIDSEAASLDSVKIALNRMFQRGGSSSNPFVSEPGSVNLLLVGLYERSLEIDEKIELLDEIKLVEPFDKPARPDSPKLLLCLVAGFAGGLFLAAATVFIRNIAD